MIAMQYFITLPDDFEEQKIRDRVKTRAPLFSKLEGLKHKTFLYDPEDKVYAPFYIWNNHQSIKDFLFGDLFNSVIQSFNRPKVRTWSVMLVEYGNPGLRPKYATMETDLISPEQNLNEMLLNEKKMMEKSRANPGLYMQVMALDAYRWEFIRYSLWDHKHSVDLAGADVVQEFEVLDITEIA